MTTSTSAMVPDELEAIVSALCRKYPEHPAAEVEAVVAHVYAELATSAKVTAHLIPLTLNRSRRLLAEESAERCTLAVAKHDPLDEGLLATSIGTNSS